MGTLTATQTYTIVDCPACNTLFAFTEQYERRRREDGQSFYCPSGHQMSYGAGEVDRLKKELATTKNQLSDARGRVTHLRDQKEAAEASARSYKGHFVRVKQQVERVEKGVCPHCKRHFSDVERHMKSRHAALVRA